MSEKHYIKREPGDLITAEDWNDLQVRVGEDIEKRVGAAIDDIESVLKSENAEKLGGKTLDELKQEILDETLLHIPKKTGYQKLFKVLKLQEESVIEHSLKACPLVDIYQLDYFEAVCAEDKDKFTTNVNFYLYHSSEKKIRDENGNSIEIERRDGRPFKIQLNTMLKQLFGEDYVPDPEQSLGDLETEFWKKLFADPNDEFDDDQYCHSPWFERCCREEKTVKKLMSSGDCDDLWFQMRPRKTVNYPIGGSPVGAITPAPTQIQVDHFDFDSLGLTLLQNPPAPVPGPPPRGNDGDGNVDPITELKVMVLLKV